MTALGRIHCPNKNTSNRSQWHYYKFYFVSKWLPYTHQIACLSHLALLTKLERLIIEYICACSLSDAQRNVHLSGECDVAWEEQMGVGPCKIHWSVGRKHSWLLPWLAPHLFMLALWRDSLGAYLRVEHFQPSLHTNRILVGHLSKNQSFAWLLCPFYAMPTQVIERCMLRSEKLKVGSSSDGDSFCSQVALAALWTTSDSSVRKRGEGSSARNKRKLASL